MVRTVTQPPARTRRLSRAVVVVSWRGSRHRWRVVSTAAGPEPTGRTSSVAAAAVGDTVPAPAVLTWQPERPVQGTLLVLRLTPAPGAALEAADGEAGGEALHFYPAGDGALESLAPVPVDASDGVEVTLTLRYASGSTGSLTASVPVTAGSYHHEELTWRPSSARR